jgi:hypothetical protein
MTLAAGLVLALASAFALNWGWIAQHGAASELPPLALRRPLRSLVSLFRDLHWLAGFLVGILGWALYIAALALAPLSLVQATAAGGIGLLAFLARRQGAPLARRDLLAVAVATGGLLLLAASLIGGAPAGGHAAPGALAAWLAVSAAVSALAAFAGSALAPGAGLGLAAGMLYAAGDVSTKAVYAGGVWLVLIAFLLGAHGTAFAALQLGFQRGSALATAGTSTLLMNALPIAAGIVVFREHLPGGVYAVLRVLAFVAVVAAAALLTADVSERSAAPARKLEEAGFEELAHDAPHA